MLISYTADCLQLSMHKSRPVYNIRLSTLRHVKGTF